MNMNAWIDDYTNLHSEVSISIGLSEDEIERVKREYKKQQLKQIINGDDTLLQEVVTELRRKKIESIRKNDK